jgi:hypothetical protein
MRIMIPLCRHCILDKATCGHRLLLSRVSANVGQHISVTHRCTEYGGTIPIGTRVEVLLKQIVSNPGYYDEGPSFEWVGAGVSRGVVEAYSRKGYFVIKLDEPKTLRLPEPKGSWSSAEEREIQTIVRRGKALKIIGEPIRNENLPYVFETAEKH